MSMATMATVHQSPPMQRIGCCNICAPRPHLSPPFIDGPYSCVHLAFLASHLAVPIPVADEPSFARVKIQKRLNKALKGVEGERGFIVDVPVSRGDNWHVVHVTCIES